MPNKHKLTWTECLNYVCCHPSNPALDPRNCFTPKKSTMTSLDDYCISWARFGLTQLSKTILHWLPLSRAFSVCLKLSHHQLGWQHKSLQCNANGYFHKSLMLYRTGYQLETKSLVTKWDISVLRKGGNLNSKSKIP